uniref:Uncharacterized protein n=1 Tax=Rhizophora mucronata TaxID=61149 RepID=A0A2P2K8R3_RHIMU
MISAKPERCGSNAVRLADNCSLCHIEGSLLSIPTIAIFIGLPITKLRRQGTAICSSFGKASKIGNKGCNCDLSNDVAGFTSINTRSICGFRAATASARHPPKESPTR